MSHPIPTQDPEDTNPLLPDDPDIDEDEPKEEDEPDEKLQDILNDSVK